MKASATRFEDWVVWQEAHPFVLAACRLTGTFPRSETEGLWRLDILRPTGDEESGVRGEMGPKLTFRWQKVNETSDSSSML